MATKENATQEAAVQEQAQEQAAAKKPSTSMFYSRPLADQKAVQYQTKSGETKNGYLLPVLQMSKENKPILVHALIPAGCCHEKGNGFVISGSEDMKVRIYASQKAFDENKLMFASDLKTFAEKNKEAQAARAKTAAEKAQDAEKAPAKRAKKELTPEERRERNLEKIDKAYAENGNRYIIMAKDGNTAPMSDNSIKVYVPSAMVENAKPDAKYYVKCTKDAQKAANDTEENKHFRAVLDENVKIQQEPNGRTVAELPARDFVLGYIEARNAQTAAEKAAAREQRLAAVNAPTASDPELSAEGLAGPNA